MALLTVAQRKSYFKTLGLGEYTKSNILKFQKMAFSNTHEHDAVYGEKTDTALRHWHHVAVYTKNFKPQEFKCPCGKCTGYPTYMRVKELKHIQAIRTHFGKPMTVTSGLRCKNFNNSLSGSSKTSRHLIGYAVDFYISGVTDTVAGRKSVIKYAKGLPNHNYSYGNNVADSNGIIIVATGMGSAVHTDTK